MKSAPNQWTKFKYYDPYKIVPKLQTLRRKVALSDLSEKEKTLRTHELQVEREYWDAIVFCYLVSEVSGIKYSMCREQDSDFDTIFTWEYEGIQNFAPIQLKELVPEELNPSLTLEKVFSKLKKYTNSDDLIVGIKLNRKISIDFDTLQIPDLPVAEVWMFGATTPNEEKWTLYGIKNGKWFYWDIEMPLQIKN